MVKTTKQVAVTLVHDEEVHMPQILWGITQQQS